MDNILVPTGQHDQNQDGHSRAFLETNDRLPKESHEDFNQELKRAESRFGIHDGNVETKQTWPKSLGKDFGNIKEIKEWVQSLKNKKFELLNADFFSRFYVWINGHFKDELQFVDVAEQTKNLIATSLFENNKVIISRVIETNVANAFGQTVEMLENIVSENGNPLIEFQLAPIESLEGIAINESNVIRHKLSMNKYSEKDLILPNNRGISYIPYVTQLRHLWLYLGTIVFAYSMCLKYPNIFKFYFGSKIPSVRDTIAIKRPEKSNDPDKEDEIIESIFVQIHENEIGLDGHFYRLGGSDEFNYHLLWETKTSRKKRSNENIDTFCKILDDGIKMEEDLFCSNTKLLNTLKKTNLDILNCQVNKNIGVPSIANMWKNKLMEVGKESKSTDILMEIGTLQSKIELYMANIRSQLEKE